MAESAGLYRRILVATDGSEPARRASRHAIQLARWSGAELIVLAVVDAPDATRLGLYRGEALAQLRNEANAAVAEIVTAAADQGVTARPLVVTGDPRSTILTQSEAIGADLVVVGAQGLSALERLLLGSVSEHVVRYSKVPVLVVRAD